jgi:hypothetical protein
MYATGIEIKLYEALDNAQDFQEAVMDLYRKEMENK